MLNKSIKVSASFTYLCKHSSKHNSPGKFRPYSLQRSPSCNPTPAQILPLNQWDVCLFVPELLHNV